MSINGIVSPATPRSTGRRGPVAKRRFQKGCFQLKNGMAYSFYYEDVQRADGAPETRRVRHFIGRVASDGISERAARSEHAGIMQSVNQKRGSVAPTIHGQTFLHAVNAWRKAIAPTHSPATVRGMESHLKIHILPRFKDSATQDLDVPTVQQFATDLIGRGLSQKSIVNILQTVFTILSYAKTCKMSVSDVGLDDLKLGGLGPQVAPYFTPSQSQAIIQAASEPHHTLFAVAALTGVRAGELLALNVSDLDFTNRTISVSKSADNNTRIIREPKTRNSKATLPMPSALEAVLRNYLQTYWKPNAPGLLFPNCKGTRPLNRDNLVKYVLKPILRKLGIPSHDTGLHAFRHGLATELANASVPLPVLQRQMRHADVRTTLKIYSHLVSETHVDVMERLAQRSIGTNVPIGTEVNA
jgi:integrase